MRAVWLLCGLISLGMGCTPEFVTLHEVPSPGISTPYGFLAVDLEIGETRDAKLILSSPGFVDRVMDIPGDGVMVMRVNRGPWKLEVRGVTAPRKVVTFGGDGKTEQAAGGEKRWPNGVLSVEVKRSFMSNAGRICAHAACTAEWTPYDDPAFDQWRAQERLIEVITPPAALGTTTPEDDGDKKPPAEPTGELLDPGADP